MQCVIFAVWLCGAGSPSLLRAAELINGVKAVVHTSVITYGEVESDVALVAEDYYRQYGRQPAVFQQKLEAVRKESFERAIKHQLILRDFEKAGYSLPESVIDEIVDDEVKRGFGDRATLTKTLQARGLTFEKWRQQVKERFLVGQLRRKNVNQETIISPHKIESYYNAHRDSYKVAEQVKLRMIMLNKGDDAETEAAHALAREVLTKLKAGAAFSEMASIYSQGTQRSQGGDWGWAERSVLRSELADLAFKLNPGELIIEGHTDPRGSDELNKRLSEQRAGAVAKHLVSAYGVDPKVLKPVGRGKENLRDAANPDSEVNRRVELVRSAI
jgi:peptidyl-prolyl cis-trans isomerase SurA